MEVSISIGVPPVILLFSWVLTTSSSYWGTPHWWKPPYHMPIIALLPAAESMIFCYRAPGSGKRKSRGKGDKSSEAGRQMSAGERRMTSTWEFKPGASIKDIQRFLLPQNNHRLSSWRYPVDDFLFDICCVSPNMMFHGLWPLPISGQAPFLVATWQHFWAIRGDQRSSCLGWDSCFPGF